MTWYCVSLDGRTVAGFPFMSLAILYVLCMARPESDRALILPERNES